METQFKKVKIEVCTNGYWLLFEDYKGAYTNKNVYVAKTLEEVKRLCEEHLLPGKDL